jgi:hypothetical protein
MAWFAKVGKVFGKALKSVGKKSGEKSKFKEASGFMKKMGQVGPSQFIALIKNLDAFKMISESFGKIFELFDNLLLVEMQDLIMSLWEVATDAETVKAIKELAGVVGGMINDNWDVVIGLIESGTGLLAAIFPA